MSANLDNAWGDEEGLDVSDDGFGWEDDDDLFGNSEDATTTSHIEHVPEINVNEDNDNDGSDGEDNDFGLGFPSATPVTASVPSPVATPTEEDAQIGWEDDDDLFGNSEDAGYGEELLEATTTTTTAATNSQHHQNKTPLPPPTPTPREQQQQQNPRSGMMPINRNDPQISKMVENISNYVTSFNRMLSSINAVLEFEYNTPQKAEELVEYYDSRPKLAEYTRSKELHRMNYKVVLPHGHVETNKERILAENLLSDNSLVSRAANQSLLADLLQVITGNDLIVQPQYFAICVATWCEFTIHIGDQGADMVDCRATLSISLPTEQGDRLSIAEVSVLVIFSPSQPMVEFKVLKIDVLLEDHSQLVGVAEFINAMEGHNNYEDDGLQQNNVSADIYRDAFLENSQRMLSLSSKGMKSALMQMDSVINIKGKLQSISNFIPGTDQLLAAAEEEVKAFAEVRNQKQQPGNGFPRPSPPPPRPSISNFIPGADQLLAAEEEAKAFAEARNRKQQSTGHAFPRPPPPPPRAPGSDEYRPKSILGGLVSSGWKTLAKSVVLPDDDDPAIYGESVPPPPPPRVGVYNEPSVPMSLYRKEDTVPEKTQNLYRKDETTNGSHLPPQEKRRTKTGSIRSFAEIGEVKSNEDEIQTEVLNSIAAKTIDDLNQNVDNKEEDEAIDYDGWDDFGLDDDVDDLDGTSDSQKLSVEEESLFVNSSDSVIVDSPPLAQELLPVIETKYNPDDDIVETRKRWVNPRPYRPYVRG
jgi:hypothetical protein